MRPRERKPAWLRDMFPKNNPARLEAVACPACGLYVLEDHDGVWERWDYGLITGDNLTVAVILDRRLARLAWSYGSRTPRLRSTLAHIGIHADGQYVTAHECGRPRVSTQRIPAPRRPRPPGKPWTADIPPAAVVEETMRIWRTPLNQLAKEES